MTTLGGNVATTPATRFAYLQSRKGDQCGDIDLEDLIRQKKPKVADKVKLLVVRTRDMDTIAHGSPHQVFQMIPALVRQIHPRPDQGGGIGLQQSGHRHRPWVRSLSRAGCRKRCPPSVGKLVGREITLHARPRQGRSSQSGHETAVTWAFRETSRTLLPRRHWFHIPEARSITTKDSLSRNACCPA